MLPACKVMPASRGHDFSCFLPFFQNFAQGFHVVAIPTLKLATIGEF